MPKLPARLSVAVSITDAGYICIEQEHPPPFEDQGTHYVQIEPRDAPLIIEWLQQAVAQNPTLPKDQEEDE